MTPTTPNGRRWTVSRSPTSHQGRNRTGTRRGPRTRAARRSRKRRASAVGRTSVPSTSSAARPTSWVVARQSRSACSARRFRNRRTTASRSRNGHPVQSRWAVWQRAATSSNGEGMSGVIGHPSGVTLSGYSGTARPSVGIAWSRRQPRVTRASSARTYSGSRLDFANGPSHATGGKARVDDVLGQGRVAADVPLRQPVEHLQRHLAEDEPQVQVGLGESPPRPGRTPRTGNPRRTSPSAAPEPGRCGPAPIIPVWSRSGVCDAVTRRRHRRPAERRQVVAVQLAGRPAHRHRRSDRRRHARPRLAPSSRSATGSSS